LKIENSWPTVRVIELKFPIIIFLTGRLVAYQRKKAMMYVVALSDITPIIVTQKGNIHYLLTSYSHIIASAERSWSNA
jgi:hypothetical protein